MSHLPGRYVELGLRLGRHVDGLVDAYFGPAELKQRVDAEELRAPADLAEDAASLVDALERDGLEPQRGRWLGAQIVGLETVARRLAGEEIAFEDEVERCYGIRPERMPEETFEAVHRELDDVLPGQGSLAGRSQAWREADPLSADKLPGVCDSLVEELRGRTRALVGLPDGEAVDVEYITDEPWAAFNYYQGDLRSRIAVNTDVPMTPPFLTGLVAHETYPGHHTERSWKELLLVRGRGQVEETILMIGAPQSLVAEGIATLAAEMALGDEEHEVTAAHLHGTGVPFDPELARAVEKAALPLQDVGTNVALMLHADGASEQDAREYLLHWGLASEQRAERALRFMTDPVWRSYSTTYTDGYRVCRAFVDGDPARFKRLLTEQLTPADLRPRRRSS
jgi:hypothetical protein